MRSFRFLGYNSHFAGTHPSGACDVNYNDDVSNTDDQEWKEISQTRIDPVPRANEKGTPRFHYITSQTDSCEIAGVAQNIEAEEEVDVATEEDHCHTNPDGNYSSLVAELSTSQWEGHGDGPLGRQKYEGPRCDLV